jgi:arsenical pump membrane protein
VSSGRRLGVAIFCLGAPGCALAAALDPHSAQSAAAQDWPAFVLVSGLLLVGAVASAAGLFEAAGHRLATLPGGEVTRFGCAAALIGVASALLNLDTAAAFLTPVLVHMARRRGRAQAPILYGCLLLANAGSLLLPGSNLTNLIVAGRLHLAGAGFAARMAPAWAVSLVITALVIALVHRKDLSTDPVQTAPNGTNLTVPSSGPRDASGSSSVRQSSTAVFAGAVVIATTVLIVALPNAALPVVATGAIAVTFEISRRHIGVSTVARAVDLPLLTGLLGIAIALGTLGRAWDLPARVLAHLGTFATAGLAAVTSIVFNNLPAASLLAARVPPHPYALLVGLDLGPNLFVTGSLSALLWFRAADQAGATPSVRHATLLGVVAASLAIVAAVSVLSAGSVR